MAGTTVIHNHNLLDKFFCGLKYQQLKRAEKKMIMNISLILFVST